MPAEARSLVKRPVLHVLLDRPFVDQCLPFFSCNVVVFLCHVVLLSPAQSLLPAVFCTVLLTLSGCKSNLNLCHKSDKDQGLLFCLSGTAITVVLCQRVFILGVDNYPSLSTIKSKESPAVSGRSKSGDAAAVASYCKGYGNMALVFLGKFMDNTPLNVYWIDMKYIRNLHNIDDRIYSVSPQVGKEERPFLGIILVCNNHKYCVPMSKPKKKHERMRDKIDFKKIVSDGKLIGVLNFNFMIPVEEPQLHIIDTKIRRHDNADTRRKRNF